MTDPIADMLTRVRNAVSARHNRVDMPASKLKTEIAKILQDEGYIAGFKLVEEKPARPGGAARPMIRLLLKYGPGGERVISGIQRVSRPGRRVYAGADGMPTRARRAGREHPHHLARGDDRPRRAKAGVGGEMLCNVWYGRGTGVASALVAPTCSLRPETRARRALLGN